VQAVRVCKQKLVADAINIDERPQQRIEIMKSLTKLVVAAISLATALTVHAGPVNGYYLNPA